MPATEEKKLNPEARQKVEEEKKGAVSSPPNMTHVKTAPKITSHTLIGGEKDANGKTEMTQADLNTKLISNSRAPLIKTNNSAPSEGQT